MTDDPSDRPWLSVVIPVYNRADLIGRAVHSVLKQADGSVEIIVSDDRSTDDTRAVVGQIQALSSMVKLVVAERNSGPSAARNNGAKIATGEWLYFLDSDDELLSGALAKIFQSGHAGGADVIYFHALACFPDGTSEFYQSQVLPPGQNAMDVRLLLKRPFTQSQLVVRSEIFRNVGRFDENLRQAEDIDFWVRLLNARAEIRVLPEVLVSKHEGGADNLTGHLDDFYFNKLKFWKKHAPAARDEGSEFYRQWWLMQLDTVYWTVYGPRKKISGLSLRYRLDYCLRWAKLVATLRGDQRRFALGRMWKSLRILIGFGQK